MFVTIIAALKVALLCAAGFMCINTGSVMGIAFGIVQVIFALLAMAGHAIMTIKQKEELYDKIVDDDTDFEDLY